MINADPIFDGVMDMDQQGVRDTSVHCLGMEQSVMGK